MYLIPLLATLMSSIFSGALPLTSRNLGHRGVAVFSILSLTLAFISSALIWIDLYIGASPVWLDLFGPWFEIGTVTVSWVFYFDLLTAHMLFTVTSVSLAVHIYAVVYMRNDPHLSLFMSYLSLFTFFMLVYVCGDNLLVMLVGWEGEQIQCLNGFLIQNNVFIYNHKNLRFKIIKSSFHTKGSSFLRNGPHNIFFFELLVGFLLGDGWLEKRGLSTRLGISLSSKYKDVAEFYFEFLNRNGYIHGNSLQKPLIRLHSNGKIESYYQLRTYSFQSLNSFYFDWYVIDSNTYKKTKKIPLDIECFLSPFALSVWIMGDGSGMRDGGFKISSHSFTQEENQLLCKTLFKLYLIKATVQNEGSKGLYYIYIWKRSTKKLLTLVKPFLKTSCFYKFKYINKN